MSPLLLDRCQTKQEVGPKCMQKGYISKIHFPVVQWRFRFRTTAKILLLSLSLQGRLFLISCPGDRCQIEQDKKSPLWVHKEYFGSGRKIASVGTETEFETQQGLKMFPALTVVNLGFQLLGSCSSFILKQSSIQLLNHCIVSRAMNFCSGFQSRKCLINGVLSILT